MEIRSGYAPRGIGRRHVLTKVVERVGEARLAQSMHGPDRFVDGLSANKTTGKAVRTPHAVPRHGALEQWAAGGSEKERPGERLNHQQSVVKVARHSTDDARRLAALLLGRICPIFSLVASGQAMASPVSVPRVTFTAGCYWIGRTGRGP